MDNTWINIGLFLTYILLAIAFLSFIGFPLIYTIRNFKNAKKGLFGFLIAIVLVFVVYLVSPADQGVLYENFGISPTQSKMIGAGLILTYVLMAGALVYLVFVEIKKWFN